MAGDSQQLNQDEIERLLQGRQEQPTAAAPVPPPAAAADANTVMRQDEIEALLSATKPAPTATPPAPIRGGAPQSGSGMASGDVDFLLHQAEQAIASINAPSASTAEVAAIPFKLHEFGGAPPSTEMATFDLIRDVELDVKIELGRTQMYLQDVLKLRRGAVVPLDKLAGDPVDIYVNGRLIARGEVLVLNENFCVRVAELVAGDAAA